MYPVSIALSLVFGLHGAAAPPAGGPALPYDGTCPVIYDNDGAIESGFTDVYIMALASAGAIDLKGIISTCSFAENERKPPFSALPDAEVVRERQELIDKARRSGMRHLPDATAGSSLSLERPASERIDDTPVMDTPGARLILAEARKATPDKPLVIVMGGQATTVVSAYLMDHSIADKMVLAWLAGDLHSDGTVHAEYNMQVDGWAAYIAFERLRVVVFPFMQDGKAGPMPHARTPKSRLVELPDTELRETMEEAAWPRGGDTYSEPSLDADGMGAMPLTRSDYVQETGHFSFGGWDQSAWPPLRPSGGPTQLPYLKADPKGRVIVMLKGDGKVATEEWWRRVKDPAAWGPAVGEVPFGGSPWPVPGLIEAEHFDEGGEGRAYHDTTNNFMREGWFNPIRCLEQVDLRAIGGASGGYAVTRTAQGEWMRYTVDVPKAGAYEAEVRVSSAGKGGIFHLEFDGADKTGPIHVPDTAGEDHWQVVKGPGMELKAGRQVMRLVIDSAGPSGSAGDIDSIRLVAAK